MQNQKLIHNISVSVFIKPEDDYEIVKTHFQKFLDPILDTMPQDQLDQTLNNKDHSKNKGDSKNKIQINESKVTGFDSRQITILELKLEKQSQIKKFIKFMLNSLTEEQISLLIRQKESRLDEDLFFFIRLDKNKLVEKDEFFITDCGNCFHIKIHIAAYPAKKDKALGLIPLILDKNHWK